MAGRLKGSGNTEPLETRVCIHGHVGNWRMSSQNRPVCRDCTANSQKKLRLKKGHVPRGGYASTPVDYDARKEHMKKQIEMLAKEIANIEIRKEIATHQQAIAELRKKLV